MVEQRAEQINYLLLKPDKFLKRAGYPALYKRTGKIQNKKHEG